MILTEIKPLMRKKELALKLGISNVTLHKLLVRAGIKNRNRNLTWTEVQKVLDLVK